MAMRSAQSLVLLFICASALSHASPAAPRAGASCDVANASRVDCRQFSQQTCQAKGCCWQPAGQNSAQPWCYYTAGFSPCKPFLPANSTTQPPFSTSEIALMRTYFLANLDIQGQGGVVASPDTNVNQGGSYYYAWERDGALSMRTLLLTSTTALSQKYFQAYVQWVLRVQSRVDPHGIDVRTEPKYLLPQGDVYPGGWCRPQTDGPALRATTLMMFALSPAVPSQSFVQQYLWTSSSSTYNGGAIKYDLDWVAANWSQNGCDLWEELQSNDFFWNRMNFRRAMVDGAAFATQMGDSARAQTYSSAAKAIEATLMGHWNGQYLFESTNRLLDTATVAGLNDGQDHDVEQQGLLFPPTSKYVAGTLTALANTFCEMFPINNADTVAGIPGILFGRYEGDHYGGGNPWILLSAQVAESFYRGASFAARFPGHAMTQEADTVWRKLLGVAGTREADKPLAPLLLAAGDGVMQRIHYHVASSGFHLAEQLDKNTGVPCSATDLTWSYGAVLKSMSIRSNAVEAVRKM